jgi:hypothetical protein
MKYNGNKTGKFKVLEKKIWSEGFKTVINFTFAQEM